MTELGIRTNKLMLAIATLAAITALGISDFAAPDETKIKARTLFMGGSSWTLRQLRKQVADSGGLIPEEHRRGIITAH